MKFRELRREKIYVVLAIIIILVGAWLRLYRLPETMIFQADQGRDAMVAQAILDGDVVLIGPVTSVGNMYLGPFYYYFMALFMIFTSPSPTGPAYGIALLNIILLGIFWLWTRKRFDEKTALLGLVLLTTNEVAVSLSRFSWNPNIGPFFAMLTYILTVEAWLKKDYRLLVLAYLVFGLLIQGHYMYLLMGGVLVVATILYGYWDRANRMKIVKSTLAGIVGWLMTWIPLVVFDIKHGGIIRQGFAIYLNEQSTKLPLGEKLIKTIRETQGRSFRILAQLNKSPNGVIDRMATYGAIAGIIGIFKFKKLKLKENMPLILVVIWLLTGILGTAVYPDTIHDHYLAYLLPGIALFWGFVLKNLWSVKVVGKAGVGVLLAVYLWANLVNTPPLAEGGPTAKHFQRISEQILSTVPPGKYNIALISENRDWRGMNYRYFLSESDHKPAHMEDYEDLETLVIIDELRRGEPLEWQIYEIQIPELTDIDKVYDIDDGPRIYIVR